MAFVMPMVWRDPTNYRYDCCFCLTSPIKAGLSIKKRSSSIPESSTCYSTHFTSTIYQFLIHPKNYEMEAENKDCVEAKPNINSTFRGPDFEEKDDTPHRQNQGKLSDLIQDLDLSKEEAELLGSILQK